MQINLNSLHQLSRPYFNSPLDLLRPPHIPFLCIRRPLSLSFSLSQVLEQLLRLLALRFPGDAIPTALEDPPSGGGSGAAAAAGRPVLSLAPPSPAEDAALRQVRGRAGGRAGGRVECSRL